MNLNLTTGLAIVAGLVLVVVVVHGAWQAHKAAPRRPRPEPPRDRQDPSLSNGHTLPPADAVDLASTPHAAKPQPGPAGADANSEAEAEAEAENSLLADVPTQPRRGLGIDHLIDAVATLLPATLVSGDMAMQHLPATRRVGTKPVAIEGLNRATDKWEAVQPGQRYRRFQAGLQLANRHGALNAIEFSEFVQKVQLFADALGAATEFPDMQEATQRGRELDRFAQNHDAQLTAQLCTNGSPWSLAFVEQCAGRLGFIPGPVAGRLLLPADEAGAPPVLMLSFDPQAALADVPGQVVLYRLQLSLDVTQTPEAAEPFAAWQQVARHLAQEIGATLLDDQGRAINLHGFTAIHQDLERLYRALEVQGLAAGTVAARRLFS